MVKRKRKSKSKRRSSSGEERKKVDRRTELEKHKQVIMERVVELEKRMAEERYEPFIEEITKKRDALLDAFDRIKEEEDKQLVIKTRLLIESEGKKTDDMLEEALALEEEERYMETQKDERGLYYIKEGKYQERKQALQEDYDNAKGFRDKASKWLKLRGLESRKLQQKFNNGVIIAPEKIASAVNTVGNVTNDIGSQFDGMGMDTGDGKGKKGKVNDFGFNTDEVFDKKKKGDGYSLTSGF